MQGDKGRDMTESKTKAAGEDVAEDLAAEAGGHRLLLATLALLFGNLRSPSGRMAHFGKRSYAVRRRLRRPACSDGR